MSLPGYSMREWSIFRRVKAKLFLRRLISLRVRWQKSIWWSSIFSLKMESMSALILVAETFLRERLAASRESAKLTIAHSLN